MTVALNVGVHVNCCTLIGMGHATSNIDDLVKVQGLEDSCPVGYGRLTQSIRFFLNFSDGCVVLFRMCTIFLLALIID